MPQRSTIICLPVASEELSHRLHEKIAQLEGRFDAHSAKLTSLLSAQDRFAFKGVLDVDRFLIGG